MGNEFTDADLESYLDETLYPELAAELELLLKTDKKLTVRLQQINGRRDAGVHTLGEIWRRHRIGVPSEEQIYDYLSGKLTREQVEYIDFRLHVLQCRFTIALRNDLENQSQPDSNAASDSRRRRYFDSSANLLNKKKN